MSEGYDLWCSEHEQFDCDCQGEDEDCGPELCPKCGRRTETGKAGECYSCVLAPRYEAMSEAALRVRNAPPSDGPGDGTQYGDLT